MDQFSLELFEHHAYSRQHELAARELMKLLHMLDAQYGQLGQNFSVQPLNAIPPQNIDLHVITRLASAISAMFSDPEFVLSEQGFSHLIVWQRWISAIFAASAFRNADHIIRALNIHGGDLAQVSLKNQHDLVKFCVLYTSESEINLDVEILWQHNKPLAATLFCALLSPRFLGSPAAHNKREVLLRWLPARLAEIGDIDTLPISILHDVYMHTSYADLPEKHQIKRPINELIRKKLLQLGYADLAVQHEKPAQNGNAVNLPAIERHAREHAALPPAGAPKPLMLVVPEWLSAVHSVYRTHSASLRAAREYFHLVAVGNPHIVDDSARTIFHEFIPLVDAPLLTQINQVYQLAKERTPQVMYYPSVGMFPLTIYLSNLRMAPLQMTALGHAASTFSPCMDYFVVDEDFIGDPTCFSETLLRMPPGGMPFVPSSAVPKDLVPRQRSRTPDVVKIAVAATTMKINPHFLHTCQTIAQQSKVPVHFHFLVGQSRGLMHPQVQQVVHNYLGHHATVHPQQPYPEYLQCFNECDMFINPFPYGNMNGIVDAASIGMVGVCMKGREVSSYIDVGMFQRAGFPNWLIANDEKSYVDASLRLAENHNERVALGEQLLANRAVERFFQGTPELFAQSILNVMPRAA